MKLPAAYVSLFAAFTTVTLQTGTVSNATVVVVLVLAVLLLVAEFGPFIVYVCRPADRKAMRKYFRARQDS